MRLDSPWALAIIFLIPVAMALRNKAKRRASLRFSSVEYTKQIRCSTRQRFINLPLFLRIAALLCLAIALSRPQKGQKQIRDISHGIAIEMIVDRSGSMSSQMNYDGQQLNRLEVVKRVFLEFVTGGGGLSGRTNDLIGMVAFARYADTISPLTLAHSALTQFLENIHLVKRKEEDGTAIGDAIALASARLKKAEDEMLKQRIGSKKDFEIKSKIIILLTDGQNNAGEYSPKEAAELAKRWGIRIYTIGVGGGDGMTRKNSLLGSFLMQAGAGVDKNMLQSIADITGGMFRMAEDGESLRSIYKEIDKMERSEIESVRYIDYREMFQPFLLASMAMLVIEIALQCTVFRSIP